MGIKLIKKSLSRLLNALFGNAVVPICIQWICQRIGKKNITILPHKYQQLTLFNYS